MTAIRTYLLEALERVVDGGDIEQDELEAVVPNPLVLDPVEKDAWQQLSHWADDADIRQRDANYSTFKRDWMRDRIAALRASGG
ncbi:hypothetical protein MOK15_06750 [Sphingobium sp. BYY-5]|uniref:hypothetical protein n=1 Tax=Sphingobium sp. BYY-5 TaxID=2926400 RepID=UPI001FA751B8|nr:hypothetical protein [Sphingobium sp. BYY-5]MCI4589787.1 hypothetical protein [Sphingobium sp. BYY-5]